MMGNVTLPSKLGLKDLLSPFLVSNALTHDIILGYNFKRAFHIGTDWNKNDEMYLKMGDRYLTTTISTREINSLVHVCRIIYNPT